MLVPPTSMPIAYFFINHQTSRREAIQNLRIEYIIIIITGIVQNINHNMARGGEKLVSMD